MKEIAERTDLPQPYLEQILLAAKGAGLVRSKRGVGGGYVLARPPDEITLAQILGAVDGPLATPVDEHDHCEGHCVLQEVWVCVSEEMPALLRGSPARRPGRANPGGASTRGRFLVRRPVAHVPSPFGWGAPRPAGVVVDGPGWC